MFGLYYFSWILIGMVWRAEMKLTQDEVPLSPAIPPTVTDSRSLAVLDQQELSALRQMLLQQSREIDLLKHQLQQQRAETQALHKLVHELLRDHATDDAQRNALPQPHVDVRGDDGGPLEAVVSQLTQRLSSLETDLQAFKARTTADINVMTQQSARDLHALQVQTTAALAWLNQTNRAQEAEIHQARTSTYVRWGSATCGSNELVYSGVMGGSLYNDTGAATNYLCLTTSPVFGPHKVPGARLFGAEYHTHDAHAYKDPVCAVCRTFSSSTIMVPGSNVCTPGWSLEYRGYLMAGGFADPAGSEFICVDSAFENTQNGDLNQDGKSLFFTVARCGSLPCSPYENDRIVLCAVCSK